MSVTRVQERLKEGAAEADRLIEAQAQANAGEAPAANEPTGVESADQDQGTTDAGVQSGGAESGQEAAESEDDLAALREELEKERQRYRSLHGMITSRDKQIEQLHTLISNMSQAQESAPSQESDDTGEPALTKDDETNFGADLVDMARRAAREEGRTLLQSVRGEIQELRDQLKGVSTTTQKITEQSFESRLDGLTDSKWRQLDSDPAFIEWLQSNKHRNRVFASAVQDQDAEEVAAVFNEYSEMQQRQTAEQEAPKNRKREQLKKQVAPGKSRSTSAPVQDQGEEKQWTRSEIAQVYRDKKNYAAAEFQELEREIAKAQRDGRVDFSR